MNKYKVAGYVRLSKEDRIKDESNSITNQKLIINSYIKNNKDLELNDFYIDDGYSGTSFDRPGFKRMFKDIINGTINIIIVKDLSRFGRNHIEVDNYLENIFPLYGVRFISILDNIDIQEGYPLDNLEVPLKNLFNDAYAKDISVKVKTALETKKKNSEFVGISAPYGYLKDPKDKHKFIIDKDVSKIVIKIFDMFLDGRSRKEIADDLNSKSILTPSSYKLARDNKDNNNFSNKWTSEMVTRILRNETYTGTLIQGIKKKVNYRTNKLIDVKKDDWIITPNHHRAIISKEKFDKVQNILDRKRGYFSSKDIFSGFLKCSDCGKSMILRKSKDKEYYYCGSFVRDGSCTNHSIRKDRLEEILMKDMQNRNLNRNFSKIDVKILNDMIDEIIIYDKNNIEVKYK